MNLTPPGMTAVLLLLILLPARLAIAGGSSAAGGAMAPAASILPANGITQADLDHLLARTTGQLDGPVHDYNAALHDLDVCAAGYRAAYLAVSRAQTELKARRIAGESEDHTIEELTAAAATYYHQAQAALGKMETAAPKPAHLWPPLVQNPLLPYTFHVTTYTLARAPLTALPAATRRRLGIDPDLRYLAANASLPATTAALANPVIQNGVIDDLKAEISSAQNQFNDSNARIQKQVDDALAPIPQQLDQAKTAAARAEADRDQAVGDLRRRIEAKDAAIADLAARVYHLRQQLTAPDGSAPAANDRSAGFVGRPGESPGATTAVFLTTESPGILTLAADSPGVDTAARLSQIKDLKTQLAALNEQIKKSDASYSERLAQARGLLPQELADAQDRLRKATNDRIEQVPALQAKIPEKDTLIRGLESQIADLQKRLLDRLTQTSSLHVALVAHDTVEGGKLHFTGTIINTGSQILTKVDLRCQETGFQVISTADPTIIPPLNPPADGAKPADSVKPAADAPRDAPYAFRSVLADTCYYLRPGEQRAITVDVDTTSVTDIDNLPPHCRVAGGTPDSASLIGVTPP